MTDKPTKADKAKKASCRRRRPPDCVTKTVKTVTAKQAVVFPPRGTGRDGSWGRLRPPRRPWLQARAEAAREEAADPGEADQVGICTPMTTSTLKALGLRNINHVVTIEDTPSIRGQILKVRHLVEVKPA
jgi:ribosomal protein L30